MTYKILALLIPIFLVIMISGCVSNGSSNNNNQCTPNWECTEWSDCIDGSQTRTCTDLNDCGTTANKPSESQNCKLQYSIGDTVQLGDLKYTVNEVFTLPFVGTGMLMEEADGIFIIVTFSIENTGKDSEYITSSDFKIIDNQDRKYEPDTGASMYLSTMGYEALLFDKLGAGLTTEGSVVFDVPSDDTGLRLKISAGLFGGSKYIMIGDVSEL